MTNVCIKSNLLFVAVTIMSNVESASVPSSQRCTYIYKRGEFRGRSCGRTRIKGSDLCQICVGRTQLPTMSEFANMMSYAEPVPERQNFQ